MILTFDIGTSSLRTALYETTGNRIPNTLSQKSYPLVTDSEGRAEIAPTLLLKTAQTCLAETLAVYRKIPTSKRSPIQAVGTSCFWHSLLGLDATAKPLTPIYTWADSRCEKDAEQLRKNENEKHYHHHSGAMLRTSFWPAKLFWLRRTERQLFKKVQTWLSPADFLYTHFCADWHTSYSMASGTGLLDRSQKNWSKIWLKKCALSQAQLGPISDSPLTSSVATLRKFPELKETLWYPAIGDGAANNLGCKAIGGKTAAINFGTSAAIRIIRKSDSPKAPRVPFGLFCYLVDRNHWLIGGAISNAGNVRAWAVKTLRLPDEKILEKELKKRAEQPTYLYARPYLITERAPDWPENQNSLLEGFHPGTDAIEIFRSLTDATYDRLATIGNLLQGKVCGPFQRVVVSGGLLRSAYGMQRLKKLLGGTPLQANKDPEGSLKGAALFTQRKIF
ncbi:MAG: FGGY family carbohydrate kinase [Chthoniobacterales bacterium]